MIAEIGEFVLLVLEFIASDDLSLIAFGCCFIAFAMALAYNLTGVQDL